MIKKIEHIFYRNNIHDHYEYGRLYYVGTRNLNYMGLKHFS
jgi:hypothetical protein